MDLRHYTNKKINPDKLNNYMYEFTPGKGENRLVIPFVKDERTEYRLIIWMTPDYKIKSIDRNQKGFIESSVRRFSDEMEKLAETVMNDLVSFDSGEISYKVLDDIVNEYQEKLKNEKAEKEAYLKQFDLTSDEGLLDFFIRDYNEKGEVIAFVPEMRISFPKLRKKGVVDESLYRKIFNVLCNHEVDELDVGWCQLAHLFLTGLKKDGFGPDFIEELRKVREKAKQIHQAVPDRGGVMIELVGLIGDNEEEWM